MRMLSGSELRDILGMVKVPGAGPGQEMEAAVLLAFGENAGEIPCRPEAGK